MREQVLRALLACVCVASALLAFSGCNRYAPGMAPNPTPPEIRMTGFHLLHGLSGDVESAPFRQDGGAYQILTSHFTSDMQMEMDVSWLDGTGRRKVALKYPCDDGQTAVSADGMWLACLANGAAAPTDTPVDYLETASLSASGTPQHAAIRLDAANTYRLPVWSPDGGYVAFVSDTMATSVCSVQVYALSSERTSATLRTTLSSDVISEAYGDTSSTPLACGLVRLGWSSDGARLLLLTFAPAEPDSNGDVERGPLLADTQIPVVALIQSGTSAATIPTAGFTPLGHLQGSGLSVAKFHTYAWNPVTGVAAIMNGHYAGSSAQIVEYTPGQRDPKALFTLPFAGFTILSLDWSSDGARLLVGVGGPICGECGLGVQNWYLYTPGGS
jgi:hypothetical protein